MNSRYNRSHSLVGHDDDTSEHEESPMKSHIISPSEEIDPQTTKNDDATSQVRTQHEEILQTLLMGRGGGGDDKS